MEDRDPLSQDETSLKSFLTAEKAAMLDNRPHIETARGVRCVIKWRGITGYGAQYFSTKMKQTLATALALKRPDINGCDHWSSSEVLRLSPNSKQPIAMTSVKEPQPSM